MTLSKAKFLADITLLQRIDFTVLDADAISSFMASLRPAFRQITEGAQNFINMVSASPELSQDPKFLPYIEMAVHESILAVNLGRIADFHQQTMDPNDVRSLLKVMTPMQVLAIRAPVLSRETRLCLEALQSLAQGADGAAGPAKTGIADAA